MNRRFIFKSAIAATSCVAAYVKAESVGRDIGEALDKCSLLGPSKEDAKYVVIDGWVLKMEDLKRLEGSSVN